MLLLLVFALGASAVPPDGVNPRNNSTAAWGNATAVGSLRPPPIDDAATIRKVEVICAADAEQLHCGAEGGGTIGCLLRWRARADTSHELSAGCLTVLEAARLQLHARSIADPAVAAACAAPLRAGVCKGAAQAGQADVPLGYKILRCLRSAHVRAGLPASCQREVTRVMMEEVRVSLSSVHMYKDGYTYV